jgi:phosphoglycerate kinase
VVAAEFKNESPAQQSFHGTPFPPTRWALDIGPKSIEMFTKELENAKTIVWNGPMGVFEMENFAKGTNAIAQALATATAKGAITIVGGGDSASAIKKAGLVQKSQPCFHRRRRVAGISGRQGPARRGCIDG